MEIKPDNILCHELIGLKVKISSYPDLNLLGLEGVILWETARTLEIESTRGRRVKVLKPGLILLVELPTGKWVKVRGDDMLGNPFDRAKRALRGECSASF
ncbi:MAG: ribonuclease P protein subunit [Acidilobaceae archaeon]